MFVTFYSLLSFKQRARSTGCPAQLAYEEAAEFPAFSHVLHGCSVFKGKVSSQIK